MTTHRASAIKRKDRIIEEWNQGQTIAAIARSTGVSRAAVLGLLENEGLRGDQSDVKAVARAESRATVVEYLRSNPGAPIEDAAAAAGIRPRTAVGYLKGTPEEALIVGTRPGRVSFDREQMLRHLRIAWAEVPEAKSKRGLTTTLYEQHNGDGPSPSLYEKRFGSWREACTAAGVPLHDRRNRVYKQTFTDDAIVAAVAAYIEETGLTSFNGYCSWAKERLGTVPSGALVVARMGRWSVARTAVIAADPRSAA